MQYNNKSSNTNSSNHNDNNNQHNSRSPRNRSSNMYSRNRVRIHNMMINGNNHMSRIVINNMNDM